MCLFLRGINRFTIDFFLWVLFLQYLWFVESNERKKSQIENTDIIDELSLKPRRKNIMHVYRRHNRNPYTKSSSFIKTLSLFQEKEKEKQKQKQEDSNSISNYRKNEIMPNEKSNILQNTFTKSVHPQMIDIEETYSVGSSDINFDTITFEDEKSEDISFQNEENTDTSQLEIDDNVLDNIIVETLGNANYSVLNAYANKLMKIDTLEEESQASTEHSKKQPLNTNKFFSESNQIEKDQITDMNSLVHDEDDDNNNNIDSDDNIDTDDNINSDENDEPLNCNLDLLKTYIIRKTKKKEDTEKNCATNSNEDKKINGETNDQENCLLSLEEGYLIRNNYLPNFEKTATKLIDINMDIKKINIHNIDEIEKCLYYLLHSYESAIRHMDICFSSDRTSVTNQFIKNIMNIIGTDNAFSIPSDFEYNNENEDISILDSTACMQLFLELMCNFSTEILHGLRGSRKNIATKKAKILATCPSKGEELTRNVKNLKSIFSSLTNHIDNKCKLYRLRGYYAVVFLIQNVIDSDNTNDNIGEDFFRSMPHLVDEILQVGQNFISVHYKFSLKKQINLSELINISNNDDFNKNGKRLQKLITFINRKQEEIKKHLKKQIADSRVLHLSILYHFSYLMLQRCYNLKEKYVELQECFKMYQSFILWWDRMITKFFSYSTTSSDTFFYLNEKEKHISCEDDSFLYYIFTYIFLNIIKITLTEVQKKHAAYIAILKTYSKNNEDIIEKDSFLKEISFHKNSIDTLKNLANALKEIKTHRSLLVRNIKLYALEDAVNKHISKILFLLKDFKEVNTTDEIQSEIIKEYNIFFPIYNKLIEAAEESLCSS